MKKPAAARFDPRPPRGGRLHAVPPGDVFEFDAMGSRCEIRIVAPDRARARAWADAAIAEVRRIETKYSRYREDSVIARINAAAGGDAVDCDDETAALLFYADSLCRSSGGRFDVTSGILRRAWDFRSDRLPDPARIAGLLPLIGWDRVEFDGKSIRLPAAGMELDFGGFGKEYAADRAAARLRELGASQGFVNLGGDIHAIGPRPDGRPWTIAIQDPRNPDGVVARFELRSGGLATSGDYERFIEVDGRRWCHILDPKTGWPVSAWRSVSVAAPLCIAAGSCSTIAMLAEGQGLELLNASGFAFLAIDALGNHHRGEGRLN